MMVPPGKPRQRADVERVQIEFLRLPGEGLSHGLLPIGQRLRFAAVNQIKIQHWKADIADQRQGVFCFRSALRASQGIGNHLIERLDP